MSDKGSGSYHVYSDREIAPPRNNYWAARRRVADGLRRLQEKVQTTGVDIDSLNALADSLNQWCQTLPDEPKLLGRKDWLAAKTYGGFFTLHTEVTPILGPSNPLSPGLSIWFEADRVCGRVTYGWMYEGVDNIVHGGWVAAVFDEFLGAAQALAGKTGMTASLKTEYFRPTPLNRELTLEARLLSCAGRKTVIRAEMYDGDLLTAACEGLFVLPGHKQVSQIFD